MDLYLALNIVSVCLMNVTSTDVFVGLLSPLHAHCLHNDLPPCMICVSATIRLFSPIGKLQGYKNSFINHVRKIAAHSVYETVYRSTI